MRALAHAQDIQEGHCRAFTIGELSLFAVRRNGELFAYHNACPHLGIPLEWQANDFLDSDGELIQCANHGALFVIESGECVFGPCRAC